MPEIRTRPQWPLDFTDCGIETFADVCCGIGGFHYAAEQQGLRCVWACDIDEACQDQYEINFGIRPKGDLTTIQANIIPDHDILFSGFPCQPFSIIGSMKGFDDQRGGIIRDIARVLRHKQPKAFVLENVRQLMSNAGGETLDFILHILRDAGYTTVHKVLNALDFGLPQKRERLIIVGFLDGNILEAWEWPEPKPQYKPLAEILESNPARRYYVSPHIRKKRQAAHSTSLRPAIWHENKAGNISSHPYSCALRANASYNYLLVDGVRRLTPREQLRLQGFPERFEIFGNDSQIRKQTGNAVPVTMVRAVIGQVLYAASQSTRHTRKTRAVSA